MRAQPRWGVLPLLAAPVGTWALGLGDIELQSALNQPFQAQIALVSPTAEDLQGLSVTLANQATFDRYGLDRPGFLSSLRFRVGRDSAGRDVILINSSESITEPFVTMLVEATWPTGRSLREYTVLLDPPLLLPAPAVQAPVQPPQSRTPEPASPGGAIQRPAPQSQPQPQPQAPTRPAPQAAPPPASVSDGGNYGPVRRSQTLWGIASEVQPSGVSVNQMMVAIYQANPQAFDNNMNLLRAGAELRIPSAAEAGGMSAANATAEVQRQTEAWRGTPGEQQARLRLVPPAETPAGVVAGDGGADASQVQSLRGELDAAQAELEENRRLLELRNQELQQLQNQLAEARAAETGADAVVDTPAPADPGVDLEVEVEEPVFADEPLEEPPVDEQVEEPVAEVQPDPAPTRAPAAVTTPEPGQSIVSRILDMVRQPFVLIGVGVGVLLLAALLFLRRKRDDDVEDVTGRWEALEAEVEAEDEEIAATARLRKQAESDDFVVVEGGRDDDTAASLLADTELDEIEDIDDFTRTTPPAAAEPPDASEETLSSQTVINLDQADPIAEADFHMAYGLYDQAAELVSRALEAQPDNRGLKLKLLEVFFVWGNKEAFLDAAQALRDEMGGQPDGDWDKVIIMGKQICPDEALFADATAAAGEVDLDLEAGESEPALDLAFDDQSVVDEDTGTHAAADHGLDLDFGGEADFGSDDLVLESTGERAASSEPETVDDDLDDGLDIGERTSAGLEAALFGIGGDDDVTATTPDVDVDSLAATQESPTVERAGLDDEDWSGVTMESPTIEAAGPESDTIEVSSVADDQDSPTMESPTIESPAVTDSPTLESEAAELPTVEQTGLHSSADLTAELDLDDLGLDVKDLENLPTGLGDLPSADDAAGDTREQPALDLGGDDDDLLSATGVTQVLRGDEEGLDALNTSVLGDDDATMMAPGLGDDSMSSKTLASTEVLEPVPDEPDVDDSSVDLNLDDLSSALEGGDTVEQPRANAFGSDIFGSGGHTPVDLDIGDDVLGNDDPTSTEEMNLDPQTMTEVGTKLDLARAYIDMGDPEGARSILEEVLDEGDTGQKREAQTLIDVLTA